MIPVDCCPDGSRLRDHLDGALSPDEHAAVTAHLDSCGSCRAALERLAVGDDLRDLARAIGREGYLPDLTPSPSDQRREDTFRDVGPLTTPDDFLALGILDPADGPGQIGRLGPYRILEVRSRGGMGVVFRAADAGLGRQVAIKVLAPQLAASASARQRFVREARAAAAVRDDHVVAIHAVGEARGFPYLVMEYVEGVSLQERLDAGVPLLLEEIVRIGTQVAAGLGAVHARGLVHRDVKPANILLEHRTGRARITDFGLARAVDDDRLTQAGVAPGTPQFMAPEQGRGEPADHRADLFSLGSVLYTMCVGTPPFRADGPMATLKRVCEDRPSAIADANPAIPAWLVAIITALHQKDPASRIQSAAEVVALLQGRRRPGPVPASSSGRAGLRVAAALALLVGGLAMAAVVLTRIPTVPPSASTEPPRDLLAGDTVGEVLRLGGGTHQAISLAFSPDGRRALVGDSWRVGDEALVLEPPYAVHVFDLGTGRELTQFEGHSFPVFAVAFDADGRHAVSADSVIRVWDAGTGREVRAMSDVPNRRPRGVALSADGRRALIGDVAGLVELWDVRSGKKLRRLEGHTEAVYCVALSPDGRLAAAGCGGDHIDGAFVGPAGKTLRLWDADSGRELHAFGGHEGSVYCVAFSADGGFVVSGGGDDRVRLWDADSGRLLRTFEGHKDSVGGVAFSPDGRRVLSGAADGSHGADGTVRLWDAESGEELQRFLAHPGGVWAVAFSPDGRHALSGGADGTVRLWRLPPPE